MKLIQIKYNGGRFPRTINLRNHKTKTFQPDKREIEFEEYDACLLLQGNSRLRADTWEFSVIGIIETGDMPLKEAEFKAETPALAPKTVEKGKDTPKRGRPRK